eukprot:8712916-Pyramimonas_sp.AAC.1
MLDYGLVIWKLGPGEILGRLAQNIRHERQGDKTWRGMQQAAWVTLRVLEMDGSDCWPDAYS